MTPHELLTRIASAPVVPKRRNVQLTEMSSIELDAYIYGNFISAPTPHRTLDDKGHAATHKYITKKDAALFRAAAIMAVDWAKRTSKTYAEQARQREIAAQQRAKRAAVEAEVRRPKLQIIDL